MAQRSRRKYCFGAESFTSQTAVMTHAAAIRSRYAIAETISKPADIAFLRDLISAHIHRADKVGSGVRRFYYDHAPDHPTTQCFWVERTDGSITDWGVPACFKGVAQLNKLSLREAVAPQVEAYKAARVAACTTTFASDFSQKEFPVSEAAVDHTVPFDSIIDQFFSTRGIDITTELLTRSVDASSKPVWRDEALIVEFTEFHRGFPLRLVHSRENLSEIKIANNALRREQLGLVDDGLL